MINRPMARLIADVLYGLGRRVYRVEVEGLEHLPRHGPAILATDEISMIGSLFIGVLIHRLVLHGKMDLPMGLAFEDIWMYSIMRGVYEISGSAALRPGKGQPVSVLLQALRHLQAGGLVMINPAGEVSFDGTFVPPQRGAAWMALRSAAPVVPVVATRAAFDIWPLWAELPSLRGRFGIRIGEPLWLASAPQRMVDDEMVQAANARLGAAMQALIAA